MIWTSDLDAGRVRKDRQELYRIRAGEMLVKQLGGWHTADIARYYRITPQAANRILRRIPPRVRDLIDRGPAPVHLREMEAIALDWAASTRKAEPPAPPEASTRAIRAKDLEATNLNRATRDIIAEIAARLAGGEPAEAIALAFDTKPAVIRRAAWEHANRSGPGKVRRIHASACPAPADDGQVGK